MNKVRAHPYCIYVYIVESELGNWPALCIIKESISIDSSVHSTFQYALGIGN